MSIAIKFVDHDAQHQADIVLFTLNRDGGPMTDREVAMRIGTHSPAVVKPLDTLKQLGYADYNLIDFDWMFAITPKGKDVALSPDFYANRPVDIDVPVTRKITDGRTKEAKEAARTQSQIVDDHKKAIEARIAAANIELKPGLRAMTTKATAAKRAEATASSPIPPAMKRCEGACKLKRPASDFPADANLFVPLVCAFCTRAKMQAEDAASKVKLTDPAAVAIDSALAEPEYGQIIRRIAHGAEWVYPDAPKFGIFSNGEMHISIPGALIVNGVLTLDPAATRALFAFVDSVPEKMLAPAKEGGAD